MKDIEKRNPGLYKEEYSKIIYGKKVVIKEETKIGNNCEIINFSRTYNPPIPYKK